MVIKYLDFVFPDLEDVIDLEEIYESIDTLEQELEELENTRVLLQKKQRVLKSFVRYAPAAIAMLDCEMRYLAVSDRWIEDFQLQDKNIIGRTHYEVFPEIPQRWLQKHQDCLMGKVDFLNCEQDSFVRQNGKVEWLRWELRPWHDSKGDIGGLLILCELITERKLLEEQLLSRESQMRKMFEAMTDFVLTIDPNEDSIQILPTQFLNGDRFNTHFQIIEQTQALLFDSFEAENYQAIIREILATRTTKEFEYSLELDSQLVWFSVNVSPLSDTVAVWSARNITHRKEIEQSLFAEKELAQVTLKSIGDAVITTDACGKIQYINPVAEALTGSSQSNSQGKPLTEVFKIVKEHTREAVTYSIDQILQENITVKTNTDTLLISQDGNEYAIEDLVTPIKDRQGKFIGAVIVFRDVTPSRDLTRKLSWQANHDVLTGLCNRRKFSEQVDFAIKDTQNNGSNHVVCYLDLDRFKAVNDSCGHAAGDELLKQVTNIIKQKIRSSDVFARLGGDEFGILLHQCTPETAQIIANQFRQTIRDFRFTWEDRVLRIGVSIGVVALDSTTKDLDSLLAQADAACYIAKQQGRNCVHLASY